MLIRCISSGSLNGNCFALTSGDLVILLDCGRAFRLLQADLNFRLPDAVLLTHEHGDHSKAIRDLLSRGVDCFMTRGTALALDLHHHRLLIIRDGDQFNISDSVKVKPFAISHDSAEPVAFLLADRLDKIIYLTDSGIANFSFSGLTKLIVEANHSEEILQHALLVGYLSRALYQRIKLNHLSVERTFSFIASLDKSRLSEIHLMHLSERHSDPDDLQRRFAAFSHINTFIH